MTLELQPILLPFAAGVDEKTRAELLGTNGFVQLENLVQKKNGAVGKGPGFASLTRNTNVGADFTACAALMSYRDELLQVATANVPVTSALPSSLYTYSATGARWYNVGTPAEALIERRVPVATGAVEDMSICNGYMLVLASGYVYVLDMATWTTVVAATNVGAPNVGAQYMRLAFAGTVAWVVYLNNATGAVSGIHIDLTSGATITAGWSGAVALIGAGGAAANLDTLGQSDRFYVAYITPGGAAAAKSFDATGALLNSVSGDVTVDAIGIGGSTADTIWLVYTKLQDIRVVGYTAALGAKATVATVVTVAGIEDIGTVSVVATTTGAGTFVASNDVITSAQSLYWGVFDTNAGAVRPGGSAGRGPVKHFRMVQTGKPFYFPASFQVPARTYCLASYQRTSQPSTQRTTFCIDLSNPPVGAVTRNARAVATIAPRLSITPGNLALNIEQAPQSTFVSGNVAYAVHSLLDSAFVTGVEAVVLDFGHPYNYSNARSLDTLAIAGGTPNYYDGQSCAELGFLVAPEILSAVGAGASAHFPNGGSWEFVAVYYYIDARGQIHFGSPSAPFNYTNSSGAGIDHVTVTVTTLQLTQRGAPSTVGVLLYRTADGGETYYRAQVGTNSFTATTITLVDFLPDTTLTAQSLLYTQPGTPGTAEPRVCPPGFLRVITHNDRLFGIEGVNVWYSGQPVVGEGPWFADAFQFPVLGGAGPLTGLASMDGRLVLFKRNRIFVVDGLGPADNGGSNDLSNPSELPVDCGCIEPRSIVVTSEGVWFQSARGLELLNRSLQLENFAGQNVENTLATTPYITSAVVDEANSRVVWTAVDTDFREVFTNLGNFIYRDLVHKTWSTKAAELPIKRAVYVGDGLGVVPYYAWTTKNAIAYQQSGSSYLYDTDYRISLITTPGIQFGGIAGFQRVREIHLLAEQKTSHDIDVSIAYDDGGFLEVHTFTAAQIAALTTAREHLSIQLSRQRCRSIAVQIKDRQPSSGSIGTGQGAEYIGLRFMVGVKKGSTRLPTGNQA